MEIRFMQRDILDYNAAFEAGPELVGGKAWTVSRLARYGFQVPPGFVLSTAVYEKFLLHAGIDVQSFQGRSIKTSLASLHKASALNIAIANTPFHDSLNVLILKELSAHQLKGPLAIRSSAVGEDGEVHAQAGIYETRLHVQGIEAIGQAVRRIWASLWTPAALAYHERKGIGEIPSCAVLFNQMVPIPSRSAFAAGVAFTCDPVTGQRDVVVLNATSGWADKLVDGSVNAEQWRIDLRERPLQAIREVALPDGNVLLPGQALALAKIAQRILWALGDGQNPVDIEWVISGEDIWITQARPITRCQANRLPGEQHLPRVWSNANIVESMPGVLRTISWEIVKLNLDQILYAPHRLGGYDLPAGLEPARRFNGRIMVDQTQFQYVNHDAFAIPPAEYNHMLGGHQGQIECDHWPALTMGKRLMCMLRRMRLIRRARVYQKDFTVQSGKSREWLKAHAHKNWRIVDNSGLASALRHLIDMLIKFGHHYALTNINGDNALLERFLAKAFKADSQALAAGLMAGAGEILSAEQSFRIDALARTALQSPAAKNFLLTAPKGSLWQALPEDDPFRVEFGAFLADFGHRCVYESEIANPRWEEKPDYIIEQVRSLVMSGMGQPPIIKAAQIQARSKARLMQLSFFKRRTAFKLLRRARAAAVRREAGKSTIICHVLPLRAILLEIGRRLVLSGHIEQVDDVFDLTSTDILAYLDGTWSGQGADTLIADRKFKRSAWMNQTVPHVIVEDTYGDGVRISKSEDRNSKAGLPGIAASPGVAEGRVRIIHHPDEAGHLHHGDILVAPAIDAGWTPLFLKAGAVIAEVGGYLSHGAIVAREFGLPAVFNIPGLLTNLEDDQMVRVDGNRGEIIRL